MKSQSRMGASSEENITTLTQRISSITLIYTKSNSNSSIFKKIFYKEMNEEYLYTTLSMQNQQNIKCQKTQLLFFIMKTILLSKHFVFSL